MMTVPGIGPLTALSFVVTIEEQRQGQDQSPSTALAMMLR